MANSEPTTKQSISDKVYDHLVDKILSMELVSGEKVSEEAIAAELSCSRAPIRDALRQLAADGLINLYPRRFAEVASYTDEQIKEIGVSRVFLDTGAIKLALQYGSRAEFIKMQALADACYEAAMGGNTSQHIKIDCDFHLQLYRMGKNQQMIEFAEQLFKKIEFIQACIYNHIIDPKVQYDQHTRLVDLLMTNQEEEACRLLTYHVSNFHGLKDEYPESFFYSN